MSTLDLSLPQADRIPKYILASIGAHVLVLMVFTVRFAFFQDEAINYEAAVRVDLVALPDKALPEVQKAAPQDVAKPIEEKKPEPVATPVPKKMVEKIVPKPVEKDAINLEKTKQKQKAALEKLKQMSALEKIEKEVEAQSKPKPQKFKGNALSAGSELRGVAKLQHDNYIAILERQIRNNWSLPQWLSKKNLSAQVRVQIDEQGRLLAREIVRSSGNPSFDEVALETVDRSVPLPAPPEQLTKILSQQGFLLGFPE